MTETTPAPAPIPQLPERSRVLVTGGTGLTGRALLRLLGRLNVEIVAVARPSSNVEDLAHLPITWFRGQVYDPPLLEEAMEGVSYIFHLAACYRDPKAPADEYRRVHVDSTRLLAELAMQRPQPPRMVHVSTVGVHGHIEHPPATESHPFSPGDIYQETKLEAELWIREFAGKTGLRLTVVRPTAIVGGEDRRLLKLHRMAKRGLFPLLGGHETLYHFVHVDDLARFLVYCAGEERCIGETFICGCPEYLDIREIMGILSGHYGTRVRFVSIPAGILFATADVVEKVCRPLGISPPIYRRRMAFFTKDRAFDTSRSRAWGFQYGYSSRGALIDTAEAYQAKGWI